MAADLHIHVFSDGELTEGDFRAFFSHTLGSKWFAPTAGRRDTESRERISDTKNVWVGEVSWLKAAVCDDAATFVPDPIARVHELIGEEWPVVDDALIAQIGAAMRLENATSYRLADVDEVLAFLERHKGKRAFTVSW